MQVRMFAKEFLITPSLRDYLERRLRFSLPSTLQIEAVDVRLRDLNGPRGGRDMECQVAISIPGRPRVIVKETQENMYNAIDGAVKRAAYRAMRLLMRQRATVRQAAGKIAKAKKRFFGPGVASEDPSPVTVNR